MRSKRGLLPLFVLAPLLFNVLERPARAAEPTLIKGTERGGTIQVESNPTVIRQRRVVVDLQRLQGKDNKRFRLPLFGRASVVLVQDRQEAPRKDTLIWYGHVDGQPGSSVILSNVREALAGDVMTRDRTGKLGFYQIRYIGNGVHILNQIDQSKFPAEGPPGEPKSPAGAADADVCGGDSASVIDALVVYTGTARQWPGGASGIEAQIYEAVAATNQSYLSSDVAQQLRLVHMEKVTYQESGNSITDRDRLQDPADGFLDDVLMLRNTYSADVVVLIVKNLDDCGRTNVMSPVSHAFESSAYAVVDVDCATTNLSFAHEVGHIMGARHDWDDDHTADPGVAYNHGYALKTPTSPGEPWRTIMAVDSGCDCDRIPYWSNPSKSSPLGGGPMGVDTGSQQSDNHKRLNETSLTVANFRCTSPVVNNVWMKDSWNDMGAEPDPKAAADVMWASPFIWVRNSRDTTSAHKYDHENPVAGSDNWVYVQLDNGGGTINGNLELYWANASTSLTWPSGWNALTSVPVSFSAGTPSKVIEVPWSPPQAGHYCLLARWGSAADPMTHPEGSEIEQNVRSNNNIVWMNVNVIDLATGPSADATFGVGAPGDEGEPFAILIQPRRGQEGASFFRHVRVTVQLDEALATAWRRGGAKGRGLRAEGGKLEISDGGALIDGLYLEPKITGRVKLTFEKLPSAPERDFIIDVVQVRPGDSAEEHPRTFGGISYVVRTRRVAPGPP
jgi:hypothetical protein